jgi:hypothetical protein
VYHETVGHFESEECRGKVTVFLSFTILSVDLHILASRSGDNGLMHMFILNISVSSLAGSGQCQGYGT